MLEAKIFSLDCERDNNIRMATHVTLEDAAAKEERSGSDNVFPPSVSIGAPLSA